FGLSFCVCPLVIHWCRHCKLGADTTDGVQRLHHTAIPRLGGIPLATAFVVALLVAAWLEPDTRRLGLLLLVVMLPTFVAGMAEDFTQRVGMKLRLLATMASAALGVWLLGALLTRVSIPGVDGILANYWIAAVIITLVAGAGVPHAINIVDGCNGLSSSVGIAAFVGLGVMAWSLGDSFVATICLLAASATLGFALWNFPRGKIFLGDGGAYSMGVLIAEMSILLIVRHPQVSAWFALLLIIHPVLEVLFSCLRRGRHGWGKMFEPDARHLHQLVYRRMFSRWLNTRNPNQQAWASAFTSLMFALWHIILLVLALVFWDNSLALVLCLAGFVVAYTLSYRFLVARRPRLPGTRPEFLRARNDTTSSPVTQTQNSRSA
ncbi:MAG: glycosyltransferase, partial [Sinobacteraceae bacterium]|nr:glycosyltransferase [Nevskiaceae bacterium]